MRYVMWCLYSELTLDAPLFPHLMAIADDTLSPIQMAPGSGHSESESSSPLQLKPKVACILMAVENPNLHAHVKHIIFSNS